VTVNAIAQEEFCILRHVASQAKKILWHHMAEYTALRQKDLLKGRKEFRLS